jgi:ATPase subunit of ABC transporter with duplicated ATPase domains
MLMVGSWSLRLGMAKMLFDPPNFLMLSSFVLHDRHSLSVLQSRAELTLEGIHRYGGGYTEYVARTGQEAPRLRS